jgi:opacity protein-like surface antigen
MLLLLKRGAPKTSATTYNECCSVAREPKRTPSHATRWRAVLLAGTAVLVGPFLIESVAQAEPNCDHYGPGSNYIFVPYSGMCQAQDRFYIGYTAGILGSNASAKFSDDSSTNLMGYGGSQGFQAGYVRTWANGWQAGVSVNYVWAHLNFSGMDVDTRVNSFGGVSARIGPTLFGDVNPYVTGGVAFTRDRFNWWGETASANQYGGSVGGGIEFPLAGSFTGSIEYKYYMFQNTTPFDDGPKFNNNYSTVMAGLNKNFSLSSDGRPHTEWPAFFSQVPPPQLNFNPYIGGQLGAGFDTFQINGLDSDMTRSIHGIGLAAGGFFGAEVPTQFAGWTTRYEVDYQATNARATLETKFGSPITKTICGETSANFLVAYRTVAAPVVAYGGLGFGSVDVTVRTERDADHQNGLALNAIAGLEAYVSRDWAVGVRDTWVSVESLTFNRSNVKTYANFVGLTATWKPSWTAF